MNTLSNLMNNFNGISLVAIMILSYCAVLKNTKRHEGETKQAFNRQYQQKRKIRIKVSREGIRKSRIPYSLVCIGSKTIRMSA